MIDKILNLLSTPAAILIRVIVGVAFFTQPVQAYVSPSGWVFELPAVKVMPPDGAEFVVSSVPVVIKTQVSKNIFTANIPNDKGGYSTVIIQKSGDQFIELPVGFNPEVPQLKMMVGE